MKTIRISMLTNINSSAGQSKHQEGLSLTYTLRKLDDWVLAGHSMGGGTVAAMAIANPARTKALVLVDGALLGSDNTLTGLALKYPPINQWAQVAFKYFIINKDNIENFLTSAYGRKPTQIEVLGYLNPLLQPGTERVLVDIIKFCVQCRS